MHLGPRNRVEKLANRLGQDGDLDYALEMCRWLLKPLGIWSFVYSETNRREKTLSILLLIASFASLVYIMVPLVCRLVLDDVTGKIRMQLLGTAINCSLSVIKYFCLVLRRKTFARCMEYMVNDWRIVTDRRHRAIMLKQATFSRSLVTLCIVFIYSSCVSFHLMMPWSRRRVVGNVTLKPLVYPSYERFFDVQVSPIYELLYCAQCFAGFVRHTVTTATFSLAVIFVTHICGQMQIQISRLEELNCELEEDDDCDPLGSIIRDHAGILRFAKKIEDGFSEIILIEIIGGTLVMCLAEYLFLREWIDNNAIGITTYIVYLISFIFTALIFCYIGEILTEQIGLVSYEINWYNLPPKKACSVILVNAISLYPPTLSGGKVAVLSLNTFSVILKSSVVYLNMLRTVTTY